MKTELKITIRLKKTKKSVFLSLNEKNNSDTARQI